MTKIESFRIYSSQILQHVRRIGLLRANLYYRVPIVLAMYTNVVVYLFTDCIYSIFCIEKKLYCLNLKNKMCVLLII